MGFFDSIVDQAQATTSMMTSKSSSATAVATKVPEITSAESLIIMDDAPVGQNLESALGLSIAETPVESVVESTTSATSATDLFGLSSMTSSVETTSSVGEVIMDTPAESSSTGFGLFMDEPSPVVESVIQDTSMNDIVLDNTEVSTPSILMDSTPSEATLLFDAADEIVEEVITPVDEAEEVIEAVEEVSVVEDITPESILAQAVASLKKISEATDAKKQSALDLEVSLRDQISEEIEAHKAKIAQLEENAENARVLAEQIEEDGKKTKERISLLEKELEAV